MRVGPYDVSVIIPLKPPLSRSTSVSTFNTSIITQQISCSVQPTMPRTLNPHVLPSVSCGGPWSLKITMLFLKYLNLHRWRQFGSHIKSLADNCPRGLFVSSCVMDPLQGFTAPSNFRDPIVVVSTGIGPECLHNQG